MVWILEALWGAIEQKDHAFLGPGSSHSNNQRDQEFRES